MLSMVFEVIQPDLEINRRHAATLLIPPTGKQCAIRFGQFCGGIRANSGSGTAAARIGLRCWAQGENVRATRPTIKALSFK
jgi:hypothetical protein